MTESLEQETTEKRTVNAVEADAAESGSAGDDLEMSVQSQIAAVCFFYTKLIPFSDVICHKNGISALFMKIYFKEMTSKTNN